MPIDIVTLATTTVMNFLLPYTKAGIEKIAKDVAEKVNAEAGDYAVELTTKVWQVIKKAFSSPKEQSTLELFQDDPEEMQDLLIKKLREKMEEDNDLSQLLSDLIYEAGPEGSGTGAEIMNAGIAGIVDMRGANLSHSEGMVVAGVNLGDKVNLFESKKSHGK